MPSPDFSDHEIIQWNAKRMISAAGGPSKLVKLLNEKQFPAPAVTTARVWNARGHIPHRWVPMVLVALLSEKKATLSELIEKTANEDLGD